MGAMGATIPAGDLGPQYAAELRILLVYLSESLGRLGQNGGPHFSFGAAALLVPRRTAPGFIDFRAILYVMHGTFAHFREEPQILGSHLETELNVFS